MVQILHRGGLSSGHWFTISTLNCPEETVNVFVSMYTDLDQKSKSLILSILKHGDKDVKFHVIPVEVKLAEQNVDCSPLLLLCH